MQTIHNWFAYAYSLIGPRLHGLLMNINLLTQSYTIDRMHMRRLFVGVLYPYNIKGHIMIGTDLGQCILIVTLWCCHAGRPGHRHHDPIFHLVTLS